MQDAEVYRRLGANIRALRDKAGWTQDELSDKSGLHRAHIGEIERGETNVTLSTMRTLADTFGTRIAELLKGL